MHQDKEEKKQCLACKILFPLSISEEASDAVGQYFSPLSIMLLINNCNLVLCFSRVSEL